MQLRQAPTVEAWSVVVMRRVTQKKTRYHKIQQRMGSLGSRQLRRVRIESLMGTIDTSQ